MKTNREIETTPDVKSVEQLVNMVDRFGDRQIKIAKLVAEQKSDKAKIEEFARLNAISYLKCSNHALRMKADEPRLVRCVGVTLEDVVDKMKDMEAFAKCVYEDYDTDAVKAILKENPENRAALLAEVGLTETTQKKKAEVKPLSK